MQLSNAKDQSKCGSFSGWSLDVGRDLGSLKQLHKFKVGLPCKSISWRFANIFLMIPRLL
jgi:hypothetical protein